MAKSLRAREPRMGQLRIIGGEWRSRKLSFLEADGLRPTPDRVRETLFNWLAPYIPAARVLDPFAGSGALYLEALSRGASWALALEWNAATQQQLQQQLQLLSCTRAKTLQADALQYLAQQPPELFDVVFLDPPFHKQLLAPVCRLLEERGWLAPSAWIYTESEHPPGFESVPMGWRLHREKRAGQVYYALWQREGC